MTKIASLLTLLATAFICLLPPAPALATGAGRTFLSAAGNDVNNCTNVATPCRHLAAAFAATAPDGEIYVLDPANYGALTITHGVSIEGHGWASIAPTSGNAAITITANAGDKINIVGVVLDGTAVSNTKGIHFTSGGSLTVRDSVIRNFSNEGIAFEPNASTQSQIYVSNTLIADNGSTGITIAAAGTGPAHGVLNRVEMENNTTDGLFVSTAGPAVRVTVSDSVSANNGDNGIDAGSIGGTANVMVQHSTIANNGADGLHAGLPGATIRVTRSTITGNATGWVNSTSGVVLSYGDNNIDDNTTVNTEPPNPLTYH